MIHRSSLHREAFGGKAKELATEVENFSIQKAATLMKSHGELGFVLHSWMENMVHPGLPC